jgi:hypothetical protein
MAVQIDKEQIERDRQGRYKVTVRWKMQSRTEAIRGIPLTFEGLPLESARGAPWIGKDGDWLVDAVYQGLVENAEPKEKDANDEYELITEVREVPLEQFPDLEFLKEQFGVEFVYRDGKAFPLYSSVRPSRRIGTPLTLDSAKATPESSPMEGVTSYPWPYVVAVWRFTRRTVPQSVVNDELSVIDRLPAGFDWRGPKLNWWVQPLQMRKVGNAWSIEWRANEITEIGDPAFFRKLRELRQSPANKR